LYLGVILHLLLSLWPIFLYHYLPLLWIFASLLEKREKAWCFQIQVAIKPTT